MTKPARALPKKTAAKEHRFWPYGLALFIALLALDQWTKQLIVSRFAVGESVRALPGVWFTYVQNTGTSWSLIRDANTALIWLSVVAFGLLLYFYDRFTTVWEKVAYSLIFVGLWGNLLDRGVHGFVIDFIDLHWWPVFNTADSCISIAVVILLIEAWRKR